MSAKLIYLARRAATVTREEWPRIWRSHAIFASQFPVLEAKIDWMRYCNRIERDVPGISQLHDGVAIAASRSLAGLNGAGFAEAERAAIDADELRVFDMLTPNFTYYCEEQPILPGALGEVAVFMFLARQTSLSHAEWHALWTGDHAAFAAAAVTAPGGPMRYVHNHPLHDPLPLFPFDGIAEAWFTSADEAVAALQSGPLADLRSDLARFCDLRQSVTMLTGVCHRWPRN
jgi:hypothetical protein